MVVALSIYSLLGLLVRVLIFLSIVILPEFIWSIYVVEDLC